MWSTSVSHGGDDTPESCLPPVKWSRRRSAFVLHPIKFVDYRTSCLGIFSLSLYHWLRVFWWLLALNDHFSILLYWCIASTLTAGVRHGAMLALNLNDHLANQGRREKNSWVYLSLLTIESNDHLYIIYLSSFKAASSSINSIRPAILQCSEKHNSSRLGNGRV